MIYNAAMKIANLLENASAIEVFDRFLPGMRAVAENNPQARTLSVEQLVRYSRVPEADKVIAAIDAALKALNTPENAITPSEAKLIERFREIDAAEKKEAKKAPFLHEGAIRPGKPWLDTKGERIQAHGGAVWYEDGLYYWYGENKTYTDGKNGIWTWGIKVYSSKDLINWDDLGYLIPPVIEDPNGPLFPARRVDRPHLVKSAATGKYVCWIKLSGPEAAFTVWQADSLLGPYEMAVDLCNPGGHKIGDFDIISDQETGKAYLYFDADHTGIQCMELSADCLRAEKKCAISYPDRKPPFTREAPALFEKDGVKYMLTSGMTGYVPNRSDAACSGTWDGVFESLGDPHVNDSSCASFNSQISKIFRIEGTETFVAMADRWLPDQPVDAELADIFTRVIAGTWDSEHYTSTEEEKKRMYAANRLETAVTSIADYVWLPITWDGNKPVLAWQDAWKPQMNA